MSAIPNSMSSTPIGDGSRFSEEGRAQKNAMDDLPPRTDNGGPPLDDNDGPEWGDGDIYVYVSWRTAHRKAWKPASRDMALFRLEKAEALGLTYEEYTLELLERGRYLSAADTERIDAIKRKRPL
jgi:hypothetical protein